MKPKLLLVVLACLMAGFLVGCADTTHSSEVVKADVQNVGAVAPLMANGALKLGAAAGAGSVELMGDWRQQANGNFYGGGAQ